MDKNIESLNPRAIWKHFADICAIPHPSFHEKKLVEHIALFARAHNLKYKIDATGNIVVSKPATKGMEDRKHVVLQSHLDMASQKVSDKEFDFTKDPIKAYIEGGWVMADGTALGADNAIGMAATLAILESDEVIHGPIQALFTVNEEQGMTGAMGLKKNFIDGDVLLNLDSEVAGELCVGGAGRVEISARFKYIEDHNEYHDREAIRIEVRGLKGGHSGHDMVWQRANANKILFRFLYLAMKHFDLNINYIDGGTDMLNAIPREATAVVCGPGKRKEDFIYGLEQFERIIKEEYKDIEDDISIKAYDCEVPPSAWDRRTMEQVISAVCGCPNGIVKMSPTVNGLVETSANLARVYSADGQIEVSSLLRSAVNTERDALANDMTAVFELAGAKIKLGSVFSGWTPNLNSHLLQTMKDCYEELFDKKPRVTAVHAGLETAIIGGLYPHMEMISFGPTIHNVHSPFEKVNIDSVGKFWSLLCCTLAHTPVK